MLNTVLWSVVGEEMLVPDVSTVLHSNSASTVS